MRPFSRSFFAAFKESTPPVVFEEEWILTAEEIFQEEVYKIAMKYSAGAVQTESLLMSTEAVL